MTRSRPDPAIPSSSMNDGGLVGLELAELHLDPRRERVDDRVLVAYRRRSPSTRSGARGDVAFADVEQDEDRLLGQEAEAADRLLLVRVEAESRIGVPASSPVLSRPSTTSSRSVGLALGRVPWRPLPLEALQAALGHGQVGEHELEVELVEVAGRVDAPVRVRVGRVLERAHDVEQRIGVAQPRQVVGRQLLGPDAPLGRGGRGRQVDVRHVGLDDLLGLEDLGEPVEPVVGDLDDPDVERDPAVAAGLGVAAGERVEDGRLARSGKPDDGDLHRRLWPGRATPASAQ